MVSVAQTLVDRFCSLGIGQAFLAAFADILLHQPEGLCMATDANGIMRSSPNPITADSSRWARWQRVPTRAVT